MRGRNVSQLPVMQIKFYEPIVADTNGESSAVEVSMEL